MPGYTITDSFDADFGVAEWYGTNAIFVAEATRRIRPDRASRAIRHHTIGGSCTP